MKNNKLKIFLFSIALLFIGISSCKYYVSHEFRNTYKDYNAYLHNDTTNVSYFKVHFKNGDVCILDEWHLDEQKEYLVGSGVLYDFNRTEIVRGKTLSFDITTIAIVETNQLDKIKSKDNARIAILTILTGANVILGAFCLANPKACFGSCPTFYLEGQHYFHDASAEGFSSAVSPALEKKDIDDLRFTTQQNSLKLSMKNEALETHAVNQVQLLAVPAKENETVFHDKNGRFFICDKVLAPQKVNAGNKSIKSEVKSIDEQEYFSTTGATDLTEKEEIIIEFDANATDKHGLLINFRQTQLTTFLFYSSLGYMGDEAGDCFAMVETNSLIKSRLEKLFHKLGEIDIHYWEESKQRWIYVNTLFETGPIAKNLQIIEIPKSKKNSDKVKVKIELSKGAWRVDYLALAAIKKEVKPIEISPSSVFDTRNSHENVRQLISEDDTDYLSTFPGDAFDITFDLPALENDNYHHLFLSTKGYYLEWIRDNWLKEKNLGKLKKMLLNDKQTWRDLATEFKTVEHEMEELFWASKYEGTE